ncbi:hypothetical protein [Vibrio gallaecicus]|uniref:hypothetical protein n=1 Tax=Vibrio gallaecicus TaxID=552386 RepID=UPI0025B3204A|nr:hypothetical protein [Vibrio gallaecicus]MDN3616073.1 hypothetical protein [Vibrio gallaecicus]
MNLKPSMALGHGNELINSIQFNSIQFNSILSTAGFQPIKQALNQKIGGEKSPLSLSNHQLNS